MSSYRYWTWHLGVHIPLRDASPKYISCEMDSLAGTTFSAGNGPWMSCYPASPMAARVS